MTEKKSDIFANTECACFLFCQADGFLKTDCGEY